MLGRSRLLHEGELEGRNKFKKDRVFNKDNNKCKQANTRLHFEGVTYQQQKVSYILFKYVHDFSFAMCQPNVCLERCNIHIFNKSLLISSNFNLIKHFNNIETTELVLLK